MWFTNPPSGHRSMHGQPGLALLPVPLLQVLPCKRLPTVRTYYLPGADMNLAEMLAHPTRSHLGRTLPAARFRPRALERHARRIDPMAIAKMPIDRCGCFVHRELHLATIAEVAAHDSEAIASVGRSTRKRPPRQVRRWSVLNGSSWN